MCARMTLLRRPDVAKVATWLGYLDETALSYDHRGGVEKPPATGFIIDSHQVRLGTGEACFSAACRAIDAWVMFPHWAPVLPTPAPQTPGSVVAMTCRILGLWWVNPCRILRRHDSHDGVERTHGFTYGTLPPHAECGEERFRVRMDANGTVWYEIDAFSKPRHWMARLGFPLARWWQLRFVRDSKAAMQRAVSSNPSITR